jgi:adenylate cyclase
LFYALTINFLISLALEINMILGKGMLFNIIKGTFYSPKVDRRIFMFLDLRGSTPIAERIGHVAFSTLIQDCFYDLAVIEKYRAEVYQYVGDEAVLMWKVNDGIKSLNCIKAFYAYQDELKKREDYYMNKYQVLPEFKAGMHVGEVTVSEVGELKRVIAYLGDTVNTSARIQGKCNELNSDFLISETLMKELKIKSEFKIEPKGNILLRGKKEEINIFSIEKAVQ